MTSAVLAPARFVTPQPAKYARCSIMDMIPPERDLFLERLARERTPSWRWDMTQEYSNQGIVPEVLRHRRSVDALVAGPLLDFSARNATAKHDLMAAEELRRDHTALDWALKTYENYRETKLFIECYLCAGCSCEEIGERLQVPADHVWWYERAFFDVRHVLDNRQAYVVHVLTPAFNFGALAQEFLAKTFSWKHSFGTDGVSAFVDITGRMTPAMEKAGQELVDGKLLKDAMNIVCSRRVNSFNEGEVMGNYFQLTEIKAKTSDHTVDSKITEGISMFLQSVGSSMRRAAAGEIPAEEPRAIEQSDRVFAQRYQNEENKPRIAEAIAIATASSVGASIQDLRNSRTSQETAKE